ncbi:vascular endothelial growth factor receptor 1-like [Actinia tenebrosa]|uniref:Vascular endothelial growth factor receptor 1-like n=1 Tax=Actinia tenebrosa TaxID=6105 RepID=A0A6P8HIG0_ACTTE|nr:vascular endothelial growth factor receptor 1-like [Actinia tenebrosa]
MKISPKKRFAVSETVGLSFLKFMEIERNEGGTYECQATNNPVEPPVTSKINIFVIYFEHSSTLLDKNGEAQIVEGEDLNITCAISPIWLDNVTWVHVPTHEFLKLGSVKVNSGTLAIRNFSRSQQGKYQCQAYDKKDGILGIANVFIKVMYKPEIDEILSSKHNISRFGDTIYLRCVARGVPVPNVTWYGLNGKIRVNGTSYYPGTSTLRLLKLNTLDFGIYSCLAKNRYGIAWHNVTVTKYCECY